MRSTARQMHESVDLISSFETRKKKKAQKATEQLLTFAVHGFLIGSSIFRHNKSFISVSFTKSYKCNECNLDVIFFK